MTPRKLLAFAALSFLWTGSQIPIYLFGAIPPYIYADIGGADRWTWITLANILALASICPFVGSLSDLFGRRYIALSGAAFVILGMVSCSCVSLLSPFLSPNLRNGIMILPHIKPYSIFLSSFSHCAADHRINRPIHEHRYRRPSICRYRRRYQRAHRPSRRLRDGARQGARKVRRHPRLHHRAVLSVGVVCRAHRRVLVMALHRTAVWALELRRSGYDRGVLLPSATHESQWT